MWHPSSVAPLKKFVFVLFLRLVLCFFCLFYCLADQSWKTLRQLLHLLTNVVRTSLRGRRESVSEAGKQRARNARKGKLGAFHAASQASEHLVTDELGKFVSSRAILPFSVALQTSQAHP